MDDLISRQAAIDALVEILDRPNHAEFLYGDEICGVLGSLPSAQPKIKCIANITLTDEQVKEAFEKARCNILAAQPERKKGEWIVNDVATERCSVCKHSFYISALFAVGGNDEPPSCPWCGADMRGDTDEQTD